MEPKNKVPAATGPKAIKLPLTFSKIPGGGDIKVLNYALTLERLEADLYMQASMRLTTGGTNAAGTTIPGLGLASTEPDVALIQEFGVVEQQHRDFLISALGSKAIPGFVYKFGIESMTRQQVLDLLLVAEATGTSAYLGAASKLHSAAYLQIAGAIQGTEARHTATLSEVANGLFEEGRAVAPLPANNGGRDTPLSPDDVLAAVSGFIFAA